MIKFVHNEILPGVLHILMPGKTPGPGRVHTTLILGDNRALLIDTGYGIGDLKGYIESITTLPITVVNTHGHIDHAGGNGQFDEVWINEADWELADHSLTHEVREGSEDLAEYLNVLNYDPYKKIPLKEGEIFDLGGRTITAVSCPGHTKGSMAFLDSKTRTMFTGDNITRRVLLIDPVKNGTTLPEFYRTLKHIESYDFDHIVAAHVPYVMDKSWIQKVKAVVESFDPEKGKTPINFNLKFPGMLPLEFTVGRDFDDPEYCGFVFDKNKLSEFLAD